MSDKTRQLVSPGLPAGMNDYGPQQMLVRTQMLRTIEDVYRRFGFIQLQTSLVQRRLALVGHEGTDMKLWQMRTDGKRVSTDPEAQLAARFDLTVPLAEYVARNMKDIHFPFRRFEQGYVYRGEKPQAGRFCGFMQFDADIVGAPTGAADAEIIWCMTEVMQALGFTEFLVRVNNRKVLNGLAEILGLDPWGPKTAGLIRTLDKLDSLGFDKVMTLLSGQSVMIIDKDSDEENKEVELKPSVTLTEDQLGTVKRYLSESGTDAQDELLSLAAFFAGRSSVGTEGVSELLEISNLLERVGVDPTVWKMDRTVARGLAYYTGPVFETILTNAPEFGSVYSGGRFDDLVARFTGDSLPSVGASIGFDRLFDAMEKMGLVDASEPEVDVFLMSFGPEYERDLFEMTAELRRGGVSCEICMSHQDRAFRAQLATALKRKAPLVLIYGDRERAEGVVQLKNTVNRSQTPVVRSELLAQVLTALGRSE